MKNGYHDVTVVSYETGTNANGKKLMEITVANAEGKKARVEVYFATPENIKISLEHLRSLGWEKNHPKGLDAIIGGKGRIEVYDEEWEDSKGNIRTSNKARLVGERPSQIRSALAKDAASAWLDKIASPNNGSAW